MGLSSQTRPLKVQGMRMQYPLVWPDGFLGCNNVIFPERLLIILYMVKELLERQITVGEVRTLSDHFTSFSCPAVFRLWRMAIKVNIYRPLWAMLNSIVCKCNCYSNSVAFSNKNTSSHFKAFRLERSLVVAFRELKGGKKLHKVTFGK